MTSSRLNIIIILITIIGIIDLYNKRLNDFNDDRNFLAVIHKIWDSIGDINCYNANTTSKCIHLEEAKIILTNTNTNSNTNSKSSDLFSMLLVDLSYLEMLHDYYYTY